MAQANIKAVISAEDKASGVIRDFGHNIGGMAASVAKIAATAGAALASAAATATVFAVKSAASFEQSRVAFETMLGSADAARVLLKDISDFAAKTPFELPQVVDATRQLLAYGSTADQVLGEVKMLGDISGGSAERFNQLAFAFGQVRAKTRLAGQEMIQFTNAGVGLRDELSKRLGVAVSEVDDKMAAGEITFEDVKAVLVSLTSEGGRFFNMMDRQSKTFGGVMSNIKDNIGRVAREVVGISETGDIREGSLFAILSAQANRLLGWLNANKEAIVSALQSIFNIAKLLATGDFQGGIFGLTEDHPFVNALFVIRELFLRMGEAMQGMLGWIQENGPAILEKLRMAFEFLRPNMEHLWHVVKDELGPSLKQLWDEVIKPALPLIGTALVVAIATAIDILSALVVAVSKVIDVFVWLSTLPQKIADSIRNAFQTSQDHLQRMADKSVQVRDAIINFFRELPGHIKQAAIDAANGFVDAFADLPGRIADKIAGVGGAIRDKLGSIDIPGVGSLRDTIPGFAAGVRNFSGGPAIVGERGPELVNLPRGSDVIPTNRLGGSTINLNVNIGMFAGTPTERRRIAQTMLDDLRDIATTQGMTLDKLVMS